MATAARAVNSIPALCEAEPGIITLCDQAPLLPPVDWDAPSTPDTEGAALASAKA
jgi:hypothetical protein